MTDVDRPVRGKRDLVEHCAIEPSAIGRLPKHRMRDSLRRNPIPVGLAPEKWRVVRAGVDELEILRIRDHVPIDGERGHMDRVSLELVVPTKRVGLYGQAKSDGSGGD